MINTNKYLLVTAFLLMLATTALNADDNVWSSGGPYNCRVMTIAIHPFDNQHIFIGTVENGIYETTDGGAVWNHIETDTLERCMRVIRIHPTGPDTMYAGTARGLFKSIDGGLSWSRLYPSTFPSNEYRPVEIHPENPSIIFTGCFGAGFKSVDGGANWIRLDLPSWASPLAFRVDPQNTNIIYLVKGSSAGQSVCKSEDIGETWYCIHNDLDTTISARDIAIDPVETQTIYIAGTDISETVGHCLAKTTDGGNNWFDITPAGLDWARLHAVRVSPVDHNIIYVCSDDNGILRSSDGGESWEEINEGLRVRSVKTMTIDSTTGIIYIGTYFDGIYRSTDQGDHWEKISYNINQTTCSDIAVNWRYPDSVFVTTANGLYLSVDGAQSWEEPIELWYPVYEMLPSPIQIDPFDPAIIYIGLVPYFSEEQSCLGRSTDGGSTWESFYEGLPTNTSFYKLRAARLNDEARRLFLTTSNGVYRSDDLGQSWSLCEGGLPQNHRFRAINVNPSDNNIIYVGDRNLYELNIYKSADCGITWETITTVQDGLYLSEIVCDPFNPEVLYISVDTLGLFKTTDGGDSWINITNNLPHNENWFTIRGILINPHNPDNVFASVQSKGFFVSHNGGADWESFSEGLPVHYGGAIPAFDPTDTCRIYLATRIHSVWTITRTPTAIEEAIPLPSSFTSYAYPNPFNASTVISFTLPNESDVEIEVFNVLGQKAASLINEYLPAGNHSILWQPYNLSSGIYFYEISAGNKKISKKLSLIK